jgi:hypothetical protein
MNTLVELRTLFRENRVPVTEYGGWYLKCGNDSWGIVDGEYYKNYVKVDKNFIKQYVIDKRMPARARAFKINPNRGYEDASESD